jgi:hypothetical protein
LAAPVAFIWLVLGFLQQGDELRLSTQALIYQVDELRESVEQQKQLVDASTKAVEASTEHTKTLISIERAYVVGGGDPSTSRANDTFASMWRTMERRPHFSSPSICSSPSSTTLGHIRAL